MKRWLKYGISLAITAVCLYLVFRDLGKPVEAGVATTYFDVMMTALASASWASTLSLYLLVLVVIHLARTLRWGNLMSSLEAVPFKPLNEASAIGFMMLIALPFRLGEFARPFLIAQRSSIRRSAAMTSVVLERIIDGLLIAVLLRVLMFFVPPDAPNIELIRVGANLMFLVFFLGFVFLLLARWKHDLVIGLMRKSLGRLVPAITDKVVGIVDGFVGALKQLPDGKNMAMFFGWTAVYWVANGAGMVLFANGFDCSGAAGRTCLPLHLNLFQGYFLLCVIIIGMMIPAGPASAGTAQAALLLGMGVFLPASVVKSSGLAYATALWVVQVAQQIVFGLFFLIRSHGSFRDIARKLREQQQNGT